jgi:glutaminyl-tRNA synthetase
VSARHAVCATVRLYNPLFTTEVPDGDKDGRDFLEFLNPNSLETLTDCRVEPALAESKPGSICQFERLGYFCADAKDAAPDAPVFNRTVTLRDDWAKMQKKTE